MRLVLDTDVVLSGLRSTLGASRVLLQAVEARVITPLLSVATVIEYEAVLKREEHLLAARLDAEDVDRFLDAFCVFADHIAPRSGTRPLVQDPDDELFMELAISGRADALVSFNVADYRPADRQASLLTVPICRPGEILRRAHMATISNFALRLPPSLMDDVKALASQDAVSVNQFIVQAAAEKVADMKARGYLSARATRAVAGDFGRVLAKAGRPIVHPGDELPDGWPTPPHGT